MFELAAGGWTGGWGATLIALVALASFWVHMLLIAAAAWLDLRELGRLARAPVRAGVVRSGRGPGGALARNLVAQIGRSKGDGIVHFSDAGHRSEVFGGVIELEAKLEAKPGELEIRPSGAIPVWPAPDRRAQAAALEAPATLEAARAAARRARGWAREVVVDLGPGDPVFLVGPSASPSLIAALDPRRWIARKRWLIRAFILAELALAAGSTVLILWPPLFDLVSALGAAAALGLFLGAQPVGVSLQEAARTPDRAYLRGRWG